MYSRVALASGYVHVIFLPLTHLPVPEQVRPFLFPVAVSPLTNQSSFDACFCSPCSALLLIAAGSVAFAPITPSLQSLSRASAHWPRRVAKRGTLGGLRAQLGEMPVSKSEAVMDKKMPEITEDMMIMMALKTRQSAALPANSKVMVFGALDRLGQLVSAARIEKHCTTTSASSNLTTVQTQIFLDILQVKGA